MASSVKHKSPKKLVKRLLRYLEHPENVSDTKFWKMYTDVIDNCEVFEQLRIQSDQFASIYPLLEGADHAQRIRLLAVLSVCARSSVSANLLAKEKRIWGFVVALYEDHFINIIREDGSKMCKFWHYDLITSLIPYTNTQTWKFAVQCGLLKHLLAEKQNEPRTCHSSQNLHIIQVILSRRTTRGSIDALISDGLFTHLEQLVQKSGNLLEGTPPCSDCNHTVSEDVNLFSALFLNVKKKYESCFFFVPHPFALLCFFRANFLCLFDIANCNILCVHYQNRRLCFNE